MLKPNPHYANLKDSYLFYRISQAVDAYNEAHPGTRLLKLGIGDVTLPLCSAVIQALHDAVEDQSRKETFHGYMPECGDPALREAIALHFRSRGIPVDPDEVFISDGASGDLGAVQGLFDTDNTVLVMDPAYPEYADSNIMAGRKVIHLTGGQENGFLPRPDPRQPADIIYICSPNNPTGAVFSRKGLQEWVDFANEHGSVIIFDAAYESFVEDDSLPRSVYESDGADRCAIEICSLSKSAGFTGTRLGYTVVPKAIVRNGFRLNDMWVRNRTTVTNGVSYIIQKGAAAVFTPEGQEQTKQNVRAYKKNAQILTRVLDEAGIWYCGGTNSPYVWMECPGGMDSWSFFDLLMNKAQIIGTPGAGFGSCGENHFRLSAFGSLEDTEEAARRLRDLLPAL
ncbi:MAG: LL-diaminopimelate aminotransferase [Clostridia bacterium]|nr:LL-diaminopimelate aminotransferase [Clostridia bacterium]